MPGHSCSALVELVIGAEHGPSRRTPTNQELRLVTGVGLPGVLERTPTNSVEPVPGVPPAGFLAAIGSAELWLVAGTTTPPLLLPTPQSRSREQEQVVPNEANTYQPRT